MIHQTTRGIYVEILGGKTETGTSSFEMRTDSAVQIYGENFQVTCIFQKQTRPYLRFSLSKTEISIGRDESCDIVFRHPTVSKKHCLLSWHEQWQIEDLESVNGIYLDGKKTLSAVLRPGNCLVVCGFEIWYLECFLYMMAPDLCTLDAFVPVYQAAKITETEAISLTLMPEKPEAIEKASIYQNTYAFRDILPLMVFPVLMLMQGNGTLNYYTYGTLVIVAFRVLSLFISRVKNKLLLKKQKKQYHFAMKAYRAAMAAVYPDCFLLEKQFMALGGLLVRHKAIVRLGEDELGNIILHDFSKCPHLVIKGDLARTHQITMQIVYQLAIYDPETALVLEKMDDDYCFCSSLRAPKEKTLWVGKTPVTCDQTHYWIEKVTDYQETAQGYDALMDLDKNVYLTQERHDFIPDSAFDTCLFSHHYARLARHRRQQSLTYFQLLQLDRMSISKIRSYYFVEQQLTGCIGCLGQMPIYMDLHEKKDGPHLLVAGMTGSGKSEWLISYLFSLAVFYDSRDVQFFFIDFKGGGLSQIFENLAHTAMILTDLEPLQISRAIAALEDEIHQREKLLLSIAREQKLANLNIHDLKHLHRRKKTTADLAHLIVIVDEFAELKLLYPEMMHSLVRLARVGRSLGVHLILSTQRPSGIVDAQILSNIKSKIVLKVAAKQDSYELLSGNDAAFLKEPGEFYCQKEAQGQLIYGRSLLIQPANPKIVFLDLDGTKRKQLILSEQQDNTLALLTESINEVSSQTEPLYFKDFVLAPGKALMQGCLGVYDDYHHRKMPLLYHDFAADGPLLVVGASAETLAILLSHFPEFERVFSLEMAMKPGRKLLLEDFSKWFMYDYDLMDRLIHAHDCLFLEKDTSAIKTRYLEKFSNCLIFDRQMAEKMLSARILLQCDSKRHIGILVRKEMCYRCQIQSAY